MGNSDWSKSIGSMGIVKKKWFKRKRFCLGKNQSMVVVVGRCLTWMGKYGVRGMLIL